MAIKYKQAKLKDINSSSILIDAVNVSKNIPEFENPYPLKEYLHRLHNVPNLILVAYESRKPIAFKISYERDGDCYSWMGGVLPEYRRQHIAEKLLEILEEWAKEHHYAKLTLKTAKKHKAMLAFNRSNGFKQVGEEKKENDLESKLLFEKQLI